MKTYNGMTRREWNLLTKLMHQCDGTVSRDFETVEQYIQRTNCKTERRTSKRGVELIKVFFENGAVKEYELANIDRTTAFVD